MGRVGAFGVGGFALDGRVVNVGARVSGAGVELGFRHVGVSVDSNHLVAVGLDGDLYAVTPSLAGVAQSVAFPGTIGVGEHRVSVVPVRGDARRVADLHGAAYGRRAFLRWVASTSSDLDAYLIFANGGSGSVNYAEPLAVVDQVDVHRDWFQAGTGTGSGRLTVGGSWSGERVNTVFVVETLTGMFRHNLTGAWSAWGPIARGVVRLLDFGVAVVFEDEAASYAAKSFTVRVGPLVEWNSQELEEGTWLFSVKGRDRAGNESAALTERAVAIIHRPNAVGDLQVTFDPSLAEPVALSWSLPGDGDLAAVEIYSNFSNTFGRLGDEIIEDAPWVTLGAGEEGYGFVPAVDGVWRFYVRTRDAAGRRSDNVETVEVDTTGLPTGVRLNVPEQVAVVARPAGSFAIAWRYRWAGGEDVGQFEVREVGGALVGSAVPVGGAVGSYSVLVVGPYAVPTSFVVAAVGVSGAEAVSAAVVGTPDSVAPSMSEPLVGVPN